MFCFTLLYVHSSTAIILMGKRELAALLNMSSLCLVMVEWLFLAVTLGCLRFVNVEFPDLITYYFLYRTKHMTATLAIHFTFYKRVKMISDKGSVHSKI